MGLFGKAKGVANVVGDVVEKVTGTVDKFNTKEQATRRAEMDMMSDTKLSKNIRPIVMIWGMLLLTISLSLCAFGVPIDTHILETVFWVSIIPMSYYFPGRSVEKWIDRRFMKK